MRAVRPALCALLVCLLPAIAACGKKGSPLAPIVHIPAQVDMISARRVGNDIYVTLTVPRQNIDTSIPADVGRVDIYGYTGRVAPTRVRWAELGTVVGSVPVQPAPLPGAPPGPPPDPAKGALQGTAVTIRETLDAADFQQGPVDPPLAARGREQVAVTPAVPPPVLPLRRFYLAIPFSPRGRPGPPGAETAVTLTDIPAPPPAPRVEYSPALVTVAWEPVGGLVGFLIDRELPRESEPFDVLAAAAAAPAYPAGPTRYSLYRDSEPDPLVLPAPIVSVPWNDVPPAPMLAAAPVLSAQHPVEFERVSCYRVRSVRGVAPDLIESEPSPVTCARPVDVFPPAPPAAPEAVAGEGAISLIWEPSAELDLGGYLVLRGEAGDATLQPLTPAPIGEASFRDTTVMPGRRYVYAVIAVDDRLPLGNRSAPSPPVEETAR